MTTEETFRLTRELTNLRQQVASANVDVSILRSENLQLEDARRGDFRLVVGLIDANSRLATALLDAISTFRDDDKTTLVTAERREAWTNALEAWQQYEVQVRAALAAGGAK